MAEVSIKGPWFRCYCDIYRNLKLRELPNELQLLFLWLLALHREGKLEGGTVDKIAWYLRVDVGTLDDQLSALREADLIDADNVPTAWDERQFPSDNSTERVQRHRKKKADGDGNGGGNVSETSITEQNIEEQNIEEQKEGFPREAVELATTLRGLILKRDQKARVPKTDAKAFDRWTGAMDKLHRIDGRGWAEIRGVVVWCQQDDFWQTNILSGPTLRKQFDKLLAQSKRKTTGGQIATKHNVGERNKESLDEFLRSIDGGERDAGENTGADLIEGGGDIRGNDGTG